MVLGADYFRTSWVRVNPRPYDIRRMVTAYHGYYPSRPKDLAYTRAVELARRDFYVPKVRPYHLNDSIKYFQHPDKSPGLPYTLMGIKCKRDVDPLIIKNCARHVKQGKWKKFTHPCNLVARSMVAKKPKFRLIWVYPAHITYIEGMFAQPLIKASIAKRGVYAQWIQYSKGDMAVLQSRLPQGKQWLGVDFSRYDASLPAWLLRDAFGILKDQISFTQYHGWGRPKSDEYLHLLWNAVVKYFIDTPYTYPSAEGVWRKHNGVPSGSYFTSLVNSVCNCIMMHYLLRGCKYASTARWILGDDSLTAVDDVDVEGLAHEARQVFGVTVNVEKTEKGKLVSFLGYRMTKDGRPKANYQKLVAQLLLPDKPDKDIFEVANRIKALQLSCFGYGSLKFTHQTQRWLEDHGLVDTTPHLSKYSDLRPKLESLGLEGFPPLTRVMQAL